MLKRLSISNYLLIDQLELDLDPGLTIITGETGSGKSILIGALALAMGERAESGGQWDATKRTVIELEVDVDPLGLQGWFNAAEIPYERRTILRRQLDPGGRSRAFVNDTPVKLEQLRELGERLVHIHSQHHTLLLNDPHFQLGLVDQVAGTVPAVEAYHAQYHRWRTLEKELIGLRETEARSCAELDYLQFQLTELDEAQLKPDERGDIEQELGRAEHAEELVQGLRAVEGCVTDASGIGPLMQRAKQALVKPARFDVEVAALLERLNSSWIELKDIGDEAERLAGAISIDPARAALMRDRLDTILRLEQKHRVRSTEELILLREELRTKVDGIGSLGDRIAALEVEVNAIQQEVNSAAKELSKVRKGAMASLATRIEDILQDLGMPHAVFRFDQTTVEPGPKGIDRIRALFSANKDRNPAPLDKVASGGELSRVMLALISLAASSQGSPTVIFDEIDTGVSGEVADRVGALMARMGADRQVLAITHLPQIASKADTHLLVAKSEGSGKVTTSIRPVTKKDRVEALAQMLSGREMTKAALENARALLKGKHPAKDPA